MPVKQYEYPAGLTARLLNTPIEKILIHEPVNLGSGFKDQEIGVFYCFVGKADEDHFFIAKQTLPGPHRPLTFLSPSRRRNQKENFSLARVSDGVPA